MERSSVFFCCVLLKMPSRSVVGGVDVIVNHFFGF